MYRVIWEVVRRSKASPITMRDSTGQSPSAVSRLGQRQRLWVNIETASSEWHVFADVLAQVYSRPSVGLMLGQRRRRLTGIEPAMGCDTDPTLNPNWVGQAYIYLRGTS